MRIFRGSIILTAAFLGCATTDSPHVARLPADVAPAQRKMACPRGGMQKLSEHFPAAAIVVSGTASVESDRAPKSGAYAHDRFASEVVAGILAAAPEDPPLVLLPVRRITYEYVRALVPARWRSRLVHVRGTPHHPWPQDYFEVFFDPRTGAPVLRKVEGYKWAGNSFEKLFQAMRRDIPNLRKGPPLPVPRESRGKGPLGMAAYLGGNIEALPGGLCLLGDGLTYRAQICPHGKDQVNVPSRWLKSGHVDEVVGVVSRPGAQAPCDFALTMISPAKALELLEQNPSERFLSFAYPRLENQNYLPLKKLCKAIKGPRNTGCASLSALELTNREVATYLRDPKTVFGQVNQAIEKGIGSLREQLRSRLRERVPQCEPPVVELPALFFADVPLGAGLSTGMAESLLPNPVNAMPLGDSVLTPQPHNQAFSAFIAREYEKLAIKNRFIDTFDYAHVSGGNLHRATHIVPYCAP